MSKVDVGKSIKNSFEYKGRVFMPYRNLTALESANENIVVRTKYYTYIESIDDYSYDDFYAVAKQHKSTDLYLLEGCVVIPTGAGLCRYYEEVNLYKDTAKQLTYYTTCCGKVVMSNWRYNKVGRKKYDYSCPRCRQTVTRTGKIKTRVGVFDV